MIVNNGDNTRLIEFMEELAEGMAIEQTFNEHAYKFYKENGNVLVYLDDEVIGHLSTCGHGTYEELQFEDWDNESKQLFEWLDEIDAYKYKYQV